MSLETLKQKIGQSVTSIAAAKVDLGTLLEHYVRTVLSCPEGEIVVEMPSNGRRFIVEKIHHPDIVGSIYISGQMVKKDGSLGQPTLGTFVDSPWVEVCLSNRLPR
jgi:hypothetical protein